MVGLAACLASGLCPAARAGSWAWWATQYGGQVTFNGLPVPGAVVTVTQDGKIVTAVSDTQGFYSFPELADGKWTIHVEMLCFQPLDGEVSVAAGVVPGKWELKLLPLPGILALASAARTEPVAAAAVTPPAAAPGAPKKADGAAPVPEAPKPAAAEDSGPRPSDGFLINGTISNAATSQFSLTPAFGNTRSSKRLYNGSFAAVVDNSTFDARPDSLTGLETPKATYNRFTGVATFGGPLNIPRLLPRGPNLFLAYQWTRNSDQNTLSGLVPTTAERSGDLSAQRNAVGQPVTILNPATGLPFAGNRVPVSAQAAALLALYPLPNIAGDTLYNYQVQTIDSTHSDAMQLRLDKSLGRRDQVYGNFALQSIRAANETLFGFVDTTDTLGLNTNETWSHRFNHGLFANLGFHFSRLRTLVKPQFESRVNVSGAAGIGGNDQDPADFGPPTLTFSSGIAGLSDVQSAFNRNRTDGLSLSVTETRGRHNITLGGDFRRQEFNVFSQQNPRGSFAFTGAATAPAAASATSAGVLSGGSDLADFLLGTPDTSTIAFGNADKYLRQSVSDLYATDDWRIRPELTINAGMRWDYGAPASELKGRLVNLDIAPAYAAVTPVLGSLPHGTLTGQTYPNSLLRPDRLGFEPRVGISWRPIPGSTLVVRGGYGIYDDTSVYQQTALALAQQAPLSKSLSVQNSAACPLSLANGFLACGTSTADTFAVDPNFRVGYAQTWQLSAQRDLPAALVATLTYLGVKGTRGVQEYLPNTFPIGMTAPLNTGPVGYAFRSSYGDSTREAVTLQLRRRLRSGFTATAQYTFSKSVDDDAALGGQGPIASGSAGSANQTGTQTLPTAQIAQNWLNLQGERGPSTFDQRHLLNASLQYTSGQGLGGGTLLTGWRGTLLKEWTLVSTIVAGSGLPETPIYLAAVPGTGFTGTIRPNGTGAALYAPSAGLHLNPAAYVAPAAGQWGTAGRDSIHGPDQFTFNQSLARTFRLKDRYSLDLRLDSTNLINHVTFTSWNTIVNGTTFGLPVAANGMRTVQTTLRLRY